MSGWPPPPAVRKPSAWEDIISYSGITGVIFYVRKGVLSKLSGEEWYSNKDLYEMIQSLADRMRGDYSELADEMRQTRELIRRYNNLYETVQRHELTIRKHEGHVATHVGRGKGMESVGNAILRWGGWVIAVVYFLYNLYCWVR